MTRTACFWKAPMTGWSWRHLPPAYENLKPVLLCLGYILVCWLFLFFLYRKKTFLKV